MPRSCVRGHQWRQREVSNGAPTSRADTTASAALPPWLPACTARKRRHCASRSRRPAAPPGGHADRQVRHCLGEAHAAGGKRIQVGRVDGQGIAGAHQPGACLSPVGGTAQCVVAMLVVHKNEQVERLSRQHSVLSSIAARAGGGAAMPMHLLDTVDRQEMLRHACCDADSRVTAFLSNCQSYWTDVPGWWGVKLDNSCQRAKSGVHWHGRSTRGQPWLPPMARSTLLPRSVRPCACCAGRCAGRSSYGEPLTE